MSASAIPRDWSRFEQPSGDQVNLVSIGNAPSAVVNQLIAGGGQTAFDLINIVGGMQKPLVDNDLILELDPSRLSNWKDTYIEQYLAPGAPGFQFIGYEGKSTACRPCCRAIRSPICRRRPARARFLRRPVRSRFKGFVALEDNYTTAGQKTGAVPQAPGQATINDPADMTPKRSRP